MAGGLVAEWQPALRNRKKTLAEIEGSGPVRGQACASILIIPIDGLLRSSAL